MPVATTAWYAFPTHLLRECSHQLTYGNVGYIATNFRDNATILMAMSIVALSLKLVAM